MRHLTVLLTTVLICAAITVASAQKKLIIIGSSTSACYNVNSVTECYVGLLDTYYNQAPPLDTFIDNHLAFGGTNCYNGMPSSYVPPYTAGGYQPYTDKNITYALSLKPDVIIVNYPTNNYDFLPADSILYCLRTIRDSANKKGVPCFVTTTQPRTNPENYNTPEMKRKLALLKDSILAEFGYFSLDFWTGLINPVDSSILYDSGDHLHMNAIGHNIIFQRILEKNIFAASAVAALPASLLQFNAIFKNNTDIISWTTTQETDVTQYEIQRSADGAVFSKIAVVNARNNAGINQYQYTDDQPLQGWNYYKIVIADRDGKKHASPVMRVNTHTGKLSIVKAFANSASQLVVALQNNLPQTIQLQVINNIGLVISKTSKKIDAGNSMLYISAPLLSNGIYHIQMTSASGETSVASFIKN